MHAVKLTAKVMQNGGWETTPPKAMTMENQPFEDVSPLNGGFSIAMLVLRVCSSAYLQELLLLVFGMILNENLGW